MVWLLLASTAPLSVCAQTADAPLKKSSESTAVPSTRRSIDSVIKGIRVGLELPVIVARLMPEHLAVWREAAGGGDPGGMWLLGLCNYYGIGGVQNEARGRDLLRRAAETGDGEAMAVWSIILRNGDLDTAPEPNEANRWLGEALSAHSRIAADLLPLLAADELLAAGKVADALGHYRHESKNGNLNATFRLACVLKMGFLMPPDMDESTRLLERNAKAGHVPSMASYGLLKSRGYFVPKNLKQGQQLVEQAAASGDPHSIALAADGYQFGVWDEKSLPQPAKARQLWKQLETATDPISTYYWAQSEWYRTPSTDPRYDKTIRPMLMDAARRGVPGATFALSVMYQHGTPTLPKDLKRCRELLEWGVAAGDADALFQLACATRYGWFAKADEDKAREMFFAAARMGSPQAITSVAMRFMNGRGVPRDEEIGFYAYLTAALAGDRDAMVAVASCYLTGTGVEKNIDRAKEWTDIGLSRGDPEAYGMLFKIQCNGKPMDLKTLGPEHIETLQRGADVGSTLCATVLAGELFSGKRMPRDTRRGIAILERLSGDLRGEAPVALGRLYLEGNADIRPDVAKAMSYLRDAADRGNEEAWMLIAFVHLGKSGAPANPTDFLHASEMAIKLGSQEAALNLALSYLSGECVPKDLARAVESFEIAIDLGSATAAVDLAQLFLEGKDGIIAPDVPRGLKLLEKALEMGNTTAAINAAFYFKTQENWAQERMWLERGYKLGDPVCANDLGVQYRFGRGVPQDFGKAFEYYMYGAEHGVTDAMMNVSWCYEQGKGTEKNLREAYLWMLKAAEAGEVKAMIFVGRMHIDGIGTPRDAKKGLEWIGKAADLGNPTAKALIAAARQKGLVP
jgi:TPR repeat protein